MLGRKMGDIKNVFCDDKYLISRTKENLFYLIEKGQDHIYLNSYDIVKGPYEYGEMGDFKINLSKSNLVWELHSAQSTTKASQH